MNVSFVLATLALGLEFVIDALTISNVDEQVTEPEAKAKKPASSTPKSKTKESSKKKSRARSKSPSASKKTSSKKKTPSKKTPTKKRKPVVPKTGVYYTKIKYERKLYEGWIDFSEKGTGRNKGQYEFHFSGYEDDDVVTWVKPEEMNHELEPAEEAEYEN